MSFFNVYILGGGKQWQTTPKNLPRMQRYQSHTSRLTELWSLPRPAQGLNTNNNNILGWLVVCVRASSLGSSH